MKVLLIHDEMLNDALPVFAAHPDAVRVFVFDPAFVSNERWSMKRVQFIADCVYEMQSVRVFHGALESVISSLGATEVVTQKTPNTRIKQWISDNVALPIRWADEPAFAEYTGKLTRFTPYWRSIASQFFSADELAAEEESARARRR